ncbi:hypothetical protein [Nannocystis radixulma]|uniref:Uncharacterized protein n=1 Tax=Nannocystis radixulma TaxID=2995305 RepID=A0ABT5BG18_9BACT|nr:hypothetical protein [Nannocystis radixulma]MDC0671916.1 hypothetical protein [Nannocystis radixulma]
MKALAPRPREKQPALLDRRQRLGFLPTLAFWNRKDIRKLTGPWLAAFAALWLILLELIRGAVPPWATKLIGAAGPLLFITVLERYVRARLERRALAQGLHDEAPQLPGSIQSLTSDGVTPTRERDGVIEMGRRRQDHP